MLSSKMGVNGSPNLERSTTMCSFHGVCIDRFPPTASHHLPKTELFGQTQDSPPPPPKKKMRLKVNAVMYGQCGSCSLRLGGVWPYQSEVGWQCLVKRSKSHVNFTNFDMMECLDARRLVRISSGSFKIKPMRNEEILSMNNKQWHQQHSRD